MISWYVRDDRTVWKQRLVLSEEKAAALANALEASTEESVKYYRYHHFLDNCTTRIRDHIDAALEGALKAKTSAPADGPTFREYAESGFAGNAPLLVAANVVLGRSSDQPTTAWEGMFLPEVFRRELGVHLGAAPEVIYARKGDSTPGKTWLGEGLLAGLGFAFAVPLLAFRRRPRIERTFRGVAGGVTGLLGAALWFLATVTAFSELRENEILLVLVPSDLLLAVFEGQRLRTYVKLRLIGLVLVLVLSFAGLFVQPLVPAIVLVGAPLVAIYISRWNHE